MLFVICTANDCQYSPLKHFFSSFTEHGIKCVVFYDISNLSERVQYRQLFNIRQHLLNHQRRIEQKAYPSNFAKLYVSMYYLLISFKFILYIEFVGSSDMPQDTIEEEVGERIRLNKKEKEEKESL